MYACAVNCVYAALGVLAVLVVVVVYFSDVITAVFTSANAVITTAIRLRYDFDNDPTTTYRARLLPFNQSINQSVKPIVAELLLGKVRNEKKKTKTNKKTAMKS